MNKVLFLTLAKKCTTELLSLGTEEKSYRIANIAINFSRKILVGFMVYSATWYHISEYRDFGLWAFNVIGILLHGCC